MSLQFIMGNSGAGKSRYAYEKSWRKRRATRRKII